MLTHRLKGLVVVLKLDREGTNGKSFTFFVIVYIIIYINIEGT